VLDGLALAYMGNKSEAVAEGEAGMVLSPITKDARNGAYLQHQLARIYLHVGENEKALDRLEPLLQMPYYLSPGWLRIDPDFAVEGESQVRPAGLGRLGGESSRAKRGILSGSPSSAEFREALRSVQDPSLRSG
jgi:hypothetical protein